ncbi:hypothetical protein Pla110_06080 [Polystyrenella longa]|uniref:Uncharacterized protein n=1 Tax=Polystyrenella longa TaxID=2528007 RepID=A0A518CIB4_9PLAN|nr:hypothetical protein Pla110_06080 [Polystyrenella longa]
MPNLSWENGGKKDGYQGTRQRWHFTMIYLAAYRGRTTVLLRNAFSK